MEWNRETRIEPTLTWTVKSMTKEVKTYNRGKAYHFNKCWKNYTATCKKN